MARLTLTDARSKMINGRPWTFRLEFQGPNSAVASGWSTKFWLATGRGRHEPVEIHYGVIGSTGSILVKDWDYVEKVAPEKEAKGYVYADTPFIRVRQATLDAATQVTIPTAAPVATIPTPVVTAPVVTAPILSSLTGPWSRIVSVQKQPDGSWWGFDAQGSKVLGMPKDAARNLVKNHAHITVAGL